MQFCAEVGVRQIQLAGYDGTHEPSTEGTRARFMENLLKTAAYAARYGVLLGFETMETPFYEHLRKGDAVRVRGEFPYLQVYPDIGNPTNALGDPCRTWKQRGGISRRRISRRQTQGCSGDVLFGTGHTAVCARNP